MSQSMFTDDFVFGTATAAYEDGKGPSIWDMFCRWPEKIDEAHTGAVACDHYHRYKEDVALMKHRTMTNDRRILRY